VSVGVANSMSLFFAHATPMLQSVSGATSRYVIKEKVEVSQSAIFSLACCSRNY
jgi:CYRIA/CYRIB Rac1 binding domain